MMHLKIRLKNYFVTLYIRFCGRNAALRRAIKKAKKLHAETGRRYRVFFFGYKYHVWTRSDIKERKHIGLFKLNLKAGDDFDGIAFFDTYNQRKEADHVHKR